MTYTPPTGSYSRLYADMADQTHLLIAGTTGSGKSTVIQGILHALLHDTPSDDRFIFIDLKKVELIDYRDLPHTIMYADDDQEAIQALQTALHYTDNRYSDMQARRIKDYYGSHIYVIIDELADLLTTISKQAEPLIQRLCQIGRAAHVHVIAATQHIPMITTAIRCNFDSRVALRTVNAQDSRNIIYRPGAERFPKPKTAGRALGYYMTDGDPILYDLPKTDEAERLRIIDYWTSYSSQSRTA